MAPNGVSMRLPPANGFEGSAVWQLPQSPASVSALPLAMVSGDGGVETKNLQIAIARGTVIAAIDHGQIFLLVVIHHRDGQLPTRTERRP